MGDWVGPLTLFGGGQIFGEDLLLGPGMVPFWIRAVTVCIINS